MQGRLAPARNPHPMHLQRHRSPENAAIYVVISGISCGRWNPLERQASAIVEPRGGIKCRCRFDIPHSDIAERFQMTLTVAHISPIMSVIACLLILIMPRLLNLVVAIFLILNGLIGLGLFKWLHM